MAFNWGRKAAAVASAAPAGITNGAGGGGAFADAASGHAAAPRDWAGPAPAGLMPQLQVVSAEPAPTEAPAEALALPIAAPEPDAGMPQPLSPEAVARGAAMRRLAASFGDIVGLMRQTPQFKHIASPTWNGWCCRGWRPASSR